MVTTTYLWDSVSDNLLTEVETGVTMMLQNSGVPKTYTMFSRNLRSRSLVVSISVVLWCFNAFGDEDRITLSFVKSIETVANYTPRICVDDGGDGILIVDAQFGSVLQVSSQDKVDRWSLGQLNDLCVPNETNNFIAVGQNVLYVDPSRKSVRMLNAFYRRHSPSDETTNVLPVSFTRVDVSNDGKHFASVCQGGILVGPLAASKLPTFYTREHRYTHIQFLPTSLNAALGTADGNVEVWDLVNGQLKVLNKGYVRNDSDDGDLTFDDRLKIHGESPNSVLDLEVIPNDRPVVVALLHRQDTDDAYPKTVLRAWATDTRDSGPIYSATIAQGLVPIDRHPVGIALVSSANVSQILVVTKGLLCLHRISAIRPKPVFGTDQDTLVKLDDFAALRGDYFVDVATHRDGTVACTHESGQISIWQLKAQ